MGRTKDQLGEAPPTIGRARQLGAVAVLVTCSAPCRRQATLKLDALRLPEDAPFDEIATRRRLVCESCGRRATKVEVAWDAESSGAIG